MTHIIPEIIHMGLLSMLPNPISATGSIRSKPCFLFYSNNLGFVLILVSSAEPEQRGERDGRLRADSCQAPARSLGGDGVPAAPPQPPIRARAPAGRGGAAARRRELPREDAGGGGVCACGCGGERSDASTAGRDPGLEG